MPLRQTIQHRWFPNLIYCCCSVCMYAGAFIFFSCYPCSCYSYIYFAVRQRQRQRRTTHAHGHIHNLSYHTTPGWDLCSIFTIKCVCTNEGPSDAANGNHMGFEIYKNSGHDNDYNVNNGFYQADNMKTSDYTDEKHFDKRIHRWVLATNNNETTLCIIIILLL